MEVLGLFREEAVQTQVWTSHGNEKIAQGSWQRGMTDQEQCLVKEKELQQAYHNAREANNQSDAEPQAI